MLHETCSHGIKRANSKHILIDSDEKDFSHFDEEKTRVEWKKLQRWSRMIPDTSCSRVLRLYNDYHSSEDIFSRKISSLESKETGVSIGERDLSNAIKMSENAKHMIS